MLDSPSRRPGRASVCLHSIATLVPYLTCTSLVLAGVILVTLLAGLLGLVFPAPSVKAYVGIALIGFAVSVGGALSYVGSCVLVFSVLGDGSPQKEELARVAFLMNGGLIACLGGFAVGVASSTAFILVNIR